MTTWKHASATWTLFWKSDYLFIIKNLIILQDLHDNLEACKCNLDMILRWLSLRFFDTNPSVIMRAMDYLKHVFSALNEDEYHVMDFEAYAFLPFLVQKVKICM